MFSAGIGIVLISLLDESIRGRVPDEVPAAIAFVLGAVSLGYAAGLLSGRVQTPRQDPTRTDSGLDERGEHGPVCPVQAGLGFGAAEYGDFVPQHEELDVLGRGRSAHQQEEPEQAVEDQVLQAQ